MSTFRHSTDPELRLQGERDDLTMSVWYDDDDDIPDHVAIRGDMGEIEVSLDDLSDFIKCLRTLGDEARKTPFTTERTETTT